MLYSTVLYCTCTLGTAPYSVQLSCSMCCSDDMSLQHRLQDCWTLQKHTAATHQLAVFVLAACQCAVTDDLPQ